MADWMMSTNLGISHHKVKKKDFEQKLRLPKNRKINLELLERKNSNKGTSFLTSYRINKKWTILNQILTFLSKNSKKTLWKTLQYTKTKRKNHFLRKLQMLNVLKINIEIKKNVLCQSCLFISLSQKQKN